MLVPLCYSVCYLLYWFDNIGWLTVWLNFLYANFSANKTHHQHEQIGHLVEATNFVYVATLFFVFHNFHLISLLCAHVADLDKHLLYCFIAGVLIFFLAAAISR